MFICVVFYHVCVVCMLFVPCCVCIVLYLVCAVVNRDCIGLSCLCCSSLFVLSFFSCFRGVFLCFACIFVCAVFYLLFCDFMFV